MSHAPAADITAALQAWDRAFKQSAEEPREGDWKLVLDALERLHQLDTHARCFYINTMGLPAFEVYLVESGKLVMTLRGPEGTSPVDLTMDVAFWAAVAAWIRGPGTAKQVGDAFMARQRVG